MSRLVASGAGWHAPLMPLHNSALHPTARRRSVGSVGCTLVWRLVAGERQER